MLNLHIINYLKFTKLTQFLYSIFTVPYWKIHGIIHHLKDLGLWDFFYPPTWTTRTSIQSREHHVFGTLIFMISWFIIEAFTSYLCPVRDWVEKSLELWDSIPNCQFWNSQWAAVIARVIKNCSFVNWEGFLPTLFTRYLNMFEVSLCMCVARLIAYPWSASCGWTWTSFAWCVGYWTKVDVGLYLTKMDVRLYLTICFYSLWWW